MTAATALVVSVGVALAYANGSNDVSKGVATLVGSGVADYRRAISWGAAWTGVGGVLGALFAGAMLATFGNGLLAPGTAPTSAAALAVPIGAAGWVLVATRTGLPVSNTHAIVGSLVGVGVLAYGVPQPRIVTGRAEACTMHHPAAVRLTVDHLHWLTSGATSLARGMNDGPKIVALVGAASVLPGGAGLSAAAMFGLVTVAMVTGSLVAGRRVTRVLAHKVTAMDHREGFAANLTTAGLVTAGAVYGLPMSTTHVASGGIFGAGAERGSLDRTAVRDILLAWVVTLPVAAGLGMAAYTVTRFLGEWAR